MIWIIHTLGFIFMWPLFLVTALGHATWTATKVTVWLLLLPFTLTYKLIKTVTS